MCGFLSQERSRTGTGSQRANKRMESTRQSFRAVMLPRRAAHSWSLAGQSMETRGRVSGPEWVTKTDVARRQLRAAIRFFFERRYPIIIHTLVAASHQVLTDLGNKSGIIGLLKGKGQSIDHIRSLNHAANFFKHADKDPEGRINIQPLTDLTAEFMMDAVVLLQRLAGEIPFEAKIFWTWFVTKHKELFEDSGEAIQEMINVDVDPDDFAGFVTMLTLHEFEEAATRGEAS